MKTRLSCPEAKQKEMRYSLMLQCLGHVFEDMQLKAIEIRTHGTSLVAQAWNRGTSIMMDFEQLYSPEDLDRLEFEGRAKRRASMGQRDLLSLSQILYLAGNYVDRTRGRLIRVRWQDQSDKIQSVTIQWEPLKAEGEAAESQLAVIEELCVHIYKQRKKINLASERQARRPFVNVARNG